jgi:hypothetical protein
MIEWPLSLVAYNMNSEDDFNDFVVNELIDLSSSEDEEKNYLDAT